MNIGKFNHFLEAKPDKRVEMLERIFSPDNHRQQQLRINRDYYDGKHWDIGESGRANTTRSGKLIWGKSKTVNRVVDGQAGSRIPRGTTGSSNDISFHSGQLQVNNYIKLFTQIYQDFIVGSDTETIAITWDGDKSDDIDEKIKELFPQPEQFVKKLMVRMITNTVATTKLIWSESMGRFILSQAEPLEITPIYEGEMQVGTIVAYYVDVELLDIDEAIYGDEEKVIYTEVYYLNSGNWHRLTMVNGRIVTKDDEGKWVSGGLSDAIDMSSLSSDGIDMNFNPYTITPNIDHAYKKFDDYELEDSEIFNWIDKNDALNSNETIAFITNQYLAMPKVTVDMDMASKLGIDINSVTFKQQIKEYQFFGGSIDTLPIKLVQGQTVPDSFYKNLDRIVDALYNDAGIPRALTAGNSFSNIAEGTAQLSMVTLSRKIQQKRDQITLHLKYVIYKYLRATGMIGEDVDVNDIPLVVTYPELMAMSRKDLLDHYERAFISGVYPKRYVQRKALEVIGEGEDLAEVKALTEAEIGGALTEVQEIRKEQEQAARSAQLEELANITAEAEQLENG
jgi:hypothetical protein